MRGIAIILLLMVSLCSKAQSPMEKMLHRNEVIYDLEILVNALKEAHPGLYRYNSSTSFASYISNLKTEIPDSMSLQACYQLYAKLIAGIRDGHTRLLLPETILRYQKLLPLSISPAPDGFYIEQDYSGTLPDTTTYKLLAVNDHTTAQIIEILYPYISRDGYIQTGLPWQLEDLGLSKWYYSTVEQPASFTIQYALHGDTFIQEIPAIRSDSLSYIIKKQHPKRNKKLKHVLMRNEVSGAREKTPAAVLKINSFHPPDIRKGRQNYNKYIKRFFKRINTKKVPVLIIDLRDNSGGESMYAIDLFRYLAKESFVAYEHVEHTRLDTFSIKVYAKDASSFDYMPNNHYYDSVSGFWRTIEHPTLTQHQPAKHGYQGEVYVLTSGKTFSAGAVFASLAKNNRRVTIIGEETGGAYKEFSAGMTPIIVLPNTHIRVQIPLVNILMHVEDPDQKGRGVIPDILLREVSNEYVVTYLESLGLF